jgi:hypothetical protein
VRVADPRLVIVGARVQDVLAEDAGDAGISRRSTRVVTATAVGAANLLVRAATGLNLIAFVGRGFRSPNLVERFFNGPTPEGADSSRGTSISIPRRASTWTSVRAGVEACVREASCSRTTCTTAIAIAATATR